jgi:hypothetical protein
MKQNRKLYRNISFNNLILFLMLTLIAACGGGGSSSDESPSNNTSSTISGSVSGTVIIAIDDEGNIVATDNTAGKTPDVSGNYPFTLTDIPIGTNIRVYLLTGSGEFPLYFSSPATNVFTLSSATTIDLGFVDTTVTQGQAIPTNDPTALSSVNAGTTNTISPPLPAGGTLIVNVTEENSGAPLPGATVIIDHASDSRQIATTTTAGTVSFVSTNGGPVTVTIGKASYEIKTLVGANISFLNIPLGSDDMHTYIQGSTTATIGYAVAVGLDDGCSSCENFLEGTYQYFRLSTNLPNRVYNLSAFAYDISGPINFTSVIGIGPFVDGQTFTWNPVFPNTPPAATLTTGTITVPASLGVIAEVGAAGKRDNLNYGEIVGTSSTGNTSPYSYTLTTFASGTANDIIAKAESSLGGTSVSIQRGVEFGGSGVDFILIAPPTNLSPIGACGSVAPTFSWTEVAGASGYNVNLITGMPSDWSIVIDAESTSFVLPDLTGTAIAAFGGLSLGVPIAWDVGAFVMPGFDINTFSFDETALLIITDKSFSPYVQCIP